VPLKPGPLTQLSKAVREGRLSATALVSASVERLEAASLLNVLVEAAFDFPSASRSPRRTFTTIDCWILPRYLKRRSPGRAPHRATPASMRFFSK
jgi:hypothetical protein